jgi:predicted nucleotidyltransferase
MIPMKDIRAFARRIAEEFNPRRIILFGSYAYGKPSEDSDVDLMVVFTGRQSAIDRALEMRLKLPYPGFPMDLLARSEGEIERRVRMNDWFMREIVANGKVLFDAGSGVGRKGRGRSRSRAARTPRAKAARA